MQQFMQPPNKIEAVWFIIFIAAQITYKELVFFDGL